MKMGFWNYDTPFTFLGSVIWNTCETLNLSLGKFSPYIFGLMMGRMPNKEKEEQK